MNGIAQRIMLVLAIALLLLPPAAALAHKLSIFAWPEGSEIRGEVMFSGGRMAKHVQITLQNTEDQTVLAETVCDEKGAFRFALPEQVLRSKPDLLLVANAGEGHRDEWRVAAKEYALAGDSSTTAAHEPASELSEAHVRRIVAEELSKALSPLRQSLAESLSPKPRLRDILGGIGWLVGLAGLAAWTQIHKGASCRSGSPSVINTSSQE